MGNNERNGIDTGIIRDTGWNVKEMSKILRCPFCDISSSPKIHQAAPKTNPGTKKNAPISAEILRDDELDHIPPSLPRNQPPKHPAATPSCLSAVFEH